MKSLTERYNELKKTTQSAILLMQVGDFFEAFGDDAEKFSKAAEITITQRHKANEVLAMCGAPYHAVRGYANKCAVAGLSVAFSTEDSGIAEVCTGCKNLVNFWTIPANTPEQTLCRICSSDDPERTKMRDFAPFNFDHCGEVLTVERIAPEVALVRGESGKVKSFNAGEFKSAFGSFPWEITKPETETKAPALALFDPQPVRLDIPWREIYGGQETRKLVDGWQIAEGLAAIDWRKVNKHAASDLCPFTLTHIMTGRKFADLDSLQACKDLGWKLIEFGVDCTSPDVEQIVAGSAHKDAISAACREASQAAKERAEAVKEARKAKTAATKARNAEVRKLSVKDDKGKERQGERIDGLTEICLVGGQLFHIPTGFFIRQDFGKVGDARKVAKQLASIAEIDWKEKDASKLVSTIKANAQAWELCKTDKQRKREADKAADLDAIRTEFETMPDDARSFQGLERTFKAFGASRIADALIALERDGVIKSQMVNCVMLYQLAKATEADKQKIIAHFGTLPEIAYTLDELKRTYSELGTRRLVLALDAVTDSGFIVRTDSGEYIKPIVKPETLKASA